MKSGHFQLKSSCCFAETEQENLLAHIVTSYHDCPFPTAPCLEHELPILVYQNVRQTRQLQGSWKWFAGWFDTLRDQQCATRSSSPAIFTGPFWVRSSRSPATASDQNAWARLAKLATMVVETASSIETQLTALRVLSLLDGRRVVLPL